MMFPFGLAACFVNEKETRITEFTEQGFRIRLCRKEPEINSVRVCFYDMEKAGYRKIKISDFKVRETSGGKCDSFLPEEFFREYEIITADTDYIDALQRLMGQYSRYIRLKLEEDDGELACTLTGYPAEKDEVHFSDFAEQRKNWFGNPQDQDRENLSTDSGNILQNRDLEYALALDRRELYTLYLENSIEDFVEIYERKNGILFPWLKGRIPDRLYIGNQFCHLLFPEEEELFKLLEKAYGEERKITLAFSYVREEMAGYVENLLGKVDKWCERHGICVEITINDWAVAAMIRKKYPRLEPCLGILLNKRKKDPRMLWKKGDRKYFCENSLNADFYREFLRQELGIHRYEWEACGYKQKIPQGKNSLHIPFYQTNTSQYCPLYAVCVNGQRGKQQYLKKCPGYCSEKVFLYPKHLNMVGRYNSLFALDWEFLEDPEARITEEIDRIVVNML